MADVMIQATGNEVVTRQWQDIDWCHNAKIVRDLRHRIFRASRLGDRRKLRNLQRLMLKCRANHEMSIRQVTQVSTGRNTPGIDKVIVKTPAARTELMEAIATYKPERAQPVKRVFIPKRNGKQRPLGIPTIMDRVMQAIVKNALEPEWEARFESSVYGFRPGRSCHDAIQRIYANVKPNLKKHWVVDADIVGAFDNIPHETVLNAIQGFPGKALIHAWLQSGILEGTTQKPTLLGTPQGGVISPLLLNIVLHGLEQALDIRYQKSGNRYRNISNRTLVRYADDFVILTETKEDADAAQKRAAEWLQERGLELSPEKTSIRHLTEGFDFLGFHVRHYPDTNVKTGWKLLIKPSKETVKAFRYRLKQEWTALVGHNAESVVRRLNPILRGWGYYFHTQVSKAIFQDIDNWMFQRVYRWCKRTHPQKSWEWIKNTYFGKAKTNSQAKWYFGGTEGRLLKLSEIPIQRHILVWHTASPDDPRLATYWEERRKKAWKNLPSPRQRDLARRQKGLCSHCRVSLYTGEELHTHHHIPRKKGGTDKRENLRLVHLYCHQQIHGKRC